MTEMIANGPKKGRRPPWIMAGLLGGLLFVILLVWLFRAALAEAALGQWCAGRDLQCRAQIVDLELGHVGVEGLRINSPEGQPFQANTAEADLEWNGPFSPRVTRVVLTEPTLRARFDGEHLSLLGLESLMGGGGGGGGGPTPTVEVNDATLILETPAGEARAQLNAEIDDAGDLIARFVAEPVLLEENGNRLDLREAIVSLETVGGEPSSMARIDVAEAALGSFVSGPFVMDATFEPEDGTGKQLAVWSAAGSALRYGGARIAVLNVSGLARLDPMEALSVPALQAAIISLSAEIGAVGIETEQSQAEAAVFEVSMARTDAGRVDGPIEARVEGAVTPYGSAQTALFDGRLKSAVDGPPFDLTGVADLVGAKAGDPLRGWLGSVTAPPPVDDHGAALRDVFSEAMDQFDASLMLDFGLAPDGDWWLSSAEPPTFKAASGLEITVTPTGETDWLRLGPGRQKISGESGLRGGGGPTVLLKALDAERAGGEVQMRVDELLLSRWTVKGLALGAVLDDVSLSVVGGDTQVTAKGLVDLGGDLSGVDVSGLQISGAVAATREDGATTIRMGEGQCLSYRAGSLVIAGVTIGQHAAPLCPAGGVLIDGEADAPGGTLALGNLALPISRGTIEGMLDMPDATLRWRAAGGLDLRLNAQALNAPLAFDGRSFLLDGDAMSAGAAFSDGPARYSFALASTDLGGEVLPADISTGQIELDLTNEPGGFEGELSIPRVLISDTLEDPAYQPMVTQVDGQVREGRLRFDGPVALQRSGAEIAELSLDLELLSLIGTARVSTGELRFAPGQLQPTQLSERLRGAFTSAAGILEADALIEIDPSGLTGNGSVRATNFGFQTAALGRVTGINGNVVFDELFGLSTPPGQVVTIGSVDPGLPLSDGVLRFQLVEGREARLERATWPFAGGRLVVEPTAWIIGQDRRTVTVRAEAIELAALGEALANEDLEVQGTVSGVFPLVLEAGSAFVRNARFLADDTGGVVRYTGAAGEQAGGANENVALAFDALKNFQYTVLELGADGDLNGEIILTIKMAGKNPEVLAGAPFAFNVSVDSRLGELLQSSRNLSSSDWLADVVAEQIRERDEQP